MNFSHSNSSLARLGGVVVFVMLLAGCQGNSESTHRFSGTVTYQGEPVKVGTIMFEPDAAQGNSGPAVAVPIQDGKFDSKTSGTGFIGGPHVVIIQGFDGNVVEPEFAPHGTPLGGGRRFVKTFDFPNDDVEVDIEMTDLLKKATTRQRAIVP